MVVTVGPGVYAMYMSLVMRKRVFRSFRPGQTQTGLLSYRTSMRLEILVTETRDFTLSRQRTTKALIRLRGCAGWSVPLLFTYKTRFLMARLTCTWTDPVNHNLFYEIGSNQLPALEGGQDKMINGHRQYCLLFFSGSVGKPWNQFIKPSTTVLHPSKAPNNELLWFILIVIVRPLSVWHFV